jgi:hypothetical protein
VNGADLLFPLLVLVPIIDWSATVVLVTLARRQPRIGFLTERAFAATVISAVTTVYAIVALNTQLGFPVIDKTAALIIIRVAIVILGMAPLAWLFLYWRRSR